MNKTLLYVLVSAVALLLVVAVAVQFFLGSAVKAGVNTLGPRITQTKVELADASLSPLSGTGTLSGLTVANPAGWSQANALSIGEVRVALEPVSLLRDTVVINDLRVDQPEFRYETRVVSSNIGDLLKHIEAAAGKAEPAEAGGRPRKFIVRHFRLDRGKVTVGVGPAAVPLGIPPIELRDLGVAEGGLTSSQLAFAVFRQVLPSIIEATTSGAATLGGTLGAAAGDAVKRAGENLQKWVGGEK